MRRQVWSYRAGWLGMVAVVLGSGAMAQAQRVERDPIEVRVRLADEKDPKAVRLHAVLDVADAKAERHWIGVSCSQAGEALRTQLGLTDGEGLVVDEVVDKSPAEKANVKKFDVLIKAGDKPLKSLEDLVNAVQNAKETPIALTTLRGGKQQTITVTPTKDPANQPGVLSLEVPAAEGLLEWFSDQPQWYEVNPEGHFTIRRPHPGIAFKYKHFTTAALPKNVSITISKTGEEPAKITVKRDDKTWEVAENKIDDLPEDIRKLVRSFLGQVQATRVSTIRPKASVDLTELKSENIAKRLSEWKKAQAESAKARPERRSVEERLESLDKKLEKLQQALEQLRDRKPQDK